jgi:DNA-binding MarR family transcriptional regulator
VGHPNDTDGRIEQAILRYLAEHPQALDTIEGIQRWWLGPDLQSIDQATITRALDGLVADGRVERRPLPSGGAVYRAGRRGERGI